MHSEAVRNPLQILHNALHQQRSQWWWHKVKHKSQTFDTFPHKMFTHVFHLPIKFWRVSLHNKFNATPFLNVCVTNCKRFHAKLRKLKESVNPLLVVWPWPRVRCNVSANDWFVMAGRGCSQNPTFFQKISQNTRKAGNMSKLIDWTLLHFFWTEREREVLQPQWYFPANFSHYCHHNYVEKCMQGNY